MYLLPNSNQVDSSQMGRLLRTVVMRRDPELALLCARSSIDILDFRDLGQIEHAVLMNKLSRPSPSQVGLHAIPLHPFPSL